MVNIRTEPDRCYPFKVQTSNEQNLQDIPFYTLLIFSSSFSSAGTFNFSSTGTFNFSSTGTFLHLNAIRTVPDRCYPFKAQTSNEQNLQDIPFYTLLIFSSTFSYPGTFNFSSAGTFLHLNTIRTVPDRCYPFKAQTSNEQNLQDIPFYALLIFSSAFSYPGTFNFSSAGTFLHLNAIRTVPDRCYPFKVQTSNEQNLQDIPFYTLLIFSSTFSSAGTFNFSSTGTFNFSSAGTFSHLNAIRTVPDRCYPFKAQTSNEQNLQDIPFYTLLIFSSTFSSARTFNFSSTGTFNFSSTGTFLHLNAIRTLPHRCYPFKAQTSNEQNLQDILFYTLLIFSSAFSYPGTFNFCSAGTFLHLNAIRTVPDRCYPFKAQTSNEQNLQDIPFYTLLIFSSAFSYPGTFNFSSAGTFLHLNAIRTVPDRCYPFKVQTSNEQNLQVSPFLYPTHF